MTAVISQDIGDEPSLETELILATSEEQRAAAYRLRYELYVEEQGMHREAADHENRWLGDHYDAQSHIFLAEAAGKAVGTFRVTLGKDVTFTEESRESFGFARFAGIVPEHDICITTRLLVRHAYRGGSLAIDLLWEGFALAARSGVELILGYCEPHLLNFYLKLGFRPFGELLNHPTNGVRVRVALVLGDLEHLKTIASPMLGALSQRPKPSLIVDDILQRLETSASVISKIAAGTTDFQQEVSSFLRDSGRVWRIMGDLSREEMRVLLDQSHILKCKPGDVLFCKGHVSRNLYVLLSGSLSVLEKGETIAQLEESGALAGEVSFFTSGERIDDVIAGPQGADVLVLADRNLRQMIASHGPLAAKFLHFIARSLCQKLADRAHAGSTD